MPGLPDRVDSLDQIKEHYQDIILGVVRGLKIDSESISSVLEGGTPRFTTHGRLEEKSDIDPRGGLEYYTSLNVVSFDDDVLESGIQTSLIGGPTAEWMYTELHDENYHDTEHKSAMHFINRLGQNAVADEYQLEMINKEFRPTGLGEIIGEGRDRSNSLETFRDQIWQAAENNIPNSRPIMNQTAAQAGFNAADDNYEMAASADVLSMEPDEIYEKFGLREYEINILDNYM